MTHRRLVWSLLLALVTGASLAAHLAAHSLISVARPGPHAHHHAMGAASPHWRTCAVVCGAVLLAALAGFALESARRGRAVAPPLWLAAVLPPVGFALADGLGAEPIIAGALLQVPLAAALFWLAHRLTGGAAALGRTLRARPRAQLAPDLFGVAPAHSVARRRTLFAFLSRERGPPLPQPV